MTVSDKFMLDTEHDLIIITCDVFPDQHGNWRENIKKQIADGLLILPPSMHCTIVRGYRSPNCGARMDADN